MPSRDPTLTRTQYLDVLRVGATIGVVTMHTWAPKVGFGKADWWFGNTVYSSCLVCVPIFVMVSGALLLDTAKDESTKVFFLKRFNRVVIPFVAWSILYSLLALNSDLYHGHFSHSVQVIAHNFPRGHVSDHLWFFYGLIPVYAVTPVLRTFVKKASRRHLMCFLVLWVLAMGGYAAVNNLPNALSPSVTVANRFVIMGLWPVLFVGYFILGYLLTTAEIGMKQRKLINVAAASGLLAIILGTYFLTRSANGVLQGYFYSYYGIPVIAMSVGLFVACREIRWPSRLSQHSWVSQLLAGFVSASLGIYLIHMAVLWQVVRFWPSSSALTSPVVRIPITSVLVIATSFLTIRIMQRIPVVKRIVA